MSYQNFLQALDKALGYNYPCSSFELSSRIFHSFSIFFYFDEISIKRGFSYIQLEYEELPKLELLRIEKQKRTKTKVSLALKKDNTIILEKIPAECESSLKKILDLSKEDFYSSQKQDIESFNALKNGKFEIPLTPVGYSSIPYYKVFDEFYSTEIGNRILEDLFYAGVDKTDNYIKFLLEMIEIIYNKQKVHFVGIGTDVAFRIKSKWYIYYDSDYAGYSTYSKDELDVYEDATSSVYYLADQNDPPEKVGEFYNILFCDRKITDNLLDYDEEIFNPSYDDDDDEDDEDDDDEYDEDDDDDEEDDDDDDDNDDDNDDDEDDEYDFDERIIDRADELGLSDDKTEPITDGIINEAYYYDSSIQILWVLKEPYDSGGGGWSLCSNLIDNYREAYDEVPTYREIINTSYCLLNNISIIEDDLSDSQIEETINSIAIINTSKMPGGTRSISSKIKKAYYIWRDILLDQIDCFEPDVIIFGVSQLVFNAYYEDLDNIEGNRNWFELHRDNQLILNSYHPSYPDFSGQQIIDAVREWQEYIDDDEEDDDDDEEDECDDDNEDECRE